MNKISVNTKQVIKLIAMACKENEEYIDRLLKVQSISSNCTSDDHIRIIVEMYNNRVVRYIINGTRSGMTITVNALTNKKTRKVRGEKPWHVVECDCWCSDILREAIIGY